jgi:hypothetical protein
MRYPSETWVAGNPSTETGGHPSSISRLKRSSTDCATTFMSACSRQQFLKVYKLRWDMPCFSRIATSNSMRLRDAGAEEAHAR